MSEAKKNDTAKPDLSLLPLPALEEMAKALPKGYARCIPGHHWKEKGKTKQSPIYRSWHNMLQRCYNKNHVYYNNYGGRGIQVHSDWFEFLNFLKDMGPRPEGLSLDRLNDNDMYSRFNCCWSTRREPPLNQRPRSATPGVCFHKASQKWRAKISPYTGYELWLGTFSTKEEALAARKQAEQLYYIR